MMPRTTMDRLRGKSFEMAVAGFGIEQPEL